MSIPSTLIPSIYVPSASHFSLSASELSPPKTNKNNMRAIMAAAAQQHIAIAALFLCFADILPDWSERLIFLPAINIFLSLVKRMLINV